MLSPDGIFANGRQSDPHDWVLCKQVVVLGDDDMNGPDDTSKTVYLGRGVSTQTIFPWDPRIGGSQTYPHILHGRVDIAATQLDDIQAKRVAICRVWNKREQVVESA